MGERYVRGDEAGRFEDSDDVGKSLAQDVRREAKTRARAGQATAATGADRRARQKANLVAEKIEVAGARPAAFRLVERALESYFLYRSSKKVGTARVEPNGKWTARFEDEDGSWEARSDSAATLLQCVGTFILAKAARAATSRPIEESNPELSAKGRRSAEEKLSAAFADRLRKARIAKLDELISDLRSAIKPA